MQFSSLFGRPLLGGLVWGEEGQVLETSKPVENSVAEGDIIAWLVAHVFAVLLHLVLPLANASLFVVPWKRNYYHPHRHHHRHCHQHHIPGMVLSRIKPKNPPMNMCVVKSTTITWSSSFIPSNRNGDEYMSLVCFFFFHTDLRGRL